MENERKLYKFLLVDAKVFDNEDFKEYNVKNIYRKLVNKYKPALSVLEYLKAYAQVELEDLQKNGWTTKDDIQRKIDAIMEREQINRSYFGLYVKAKAANAKEIDIQLGDVVFASMSDEQKVAIEQIFDYYYEMYKTENCTSQAFFYERLMRNVDKLEKIFFSSYAFLDLYDEKEWCAIDSSTFIHSLEGLSVILLSDKENSNGDGSDNIELIVNKLRAKDDILFDQYGVENAVDSEILLGFLVVEALLNIYGNYLLKSANREKKKYRKNIQVGYEDKEALDELIGFLKSQKAELEKCKEDQYEERKKDIKLIEDVFVNLVKTYRISRELELQYMENFIASDIDFMRYKKMVDKLEELLKVYDEGKNTKYVKLESEGEKAKDKQRRELNEKKQYEAFSEMIKVYESIAANKRTAMSKVTARLNRKISQDSKAHGELINNDLYKSIFNDLKKETNAIGQMFRSVANAKSESMRMHIKDNANEFYIYNDIAIMTLTFPNTVIGKYKKAAIIVNKKDITKIYLNSGKRCWTFRNGLECTHSEYKSKTKTMKPDRITTDAGRLILLDALKGVRTKKISLKKIEKESEEKRKIYYSISHKFDLRSEMIAEATDKSKTNEEKYYSGKLRIEEVGDLADCNTVCHNNMQNNKGAAILYFDDAEKFKDFLNDL